MWKLQQLANTHLKLDFKKLRWLHQRSFFIFEEKVNLSTQLFPMNSVYRVMMNLKYIITIGLSSILFTAASTAEEGKKKKGGQKAKRTFEQVDTDKDGKISLAEFTTGMPSQEKATKIFGKKDKDADGYLTAEEYAAKGGKGKKGGKGDKKEKKEAA